VIGYDADIALRDPAKRATISHAGPHHGANYTLYEGLEITGYPAAIMLRGLVVVRDGGLIGKKRQ
jgi:dihydropyrimidinase